jgi:hypothetical protein
MAKSPEAMAQAMVDNMKEKTGKSLDQWLKIVARSKLQKHGAIVKHLKTEHGVTHGYANMIAHSALQSDASHQDDGDLVAAQYAGAKAALRPIYDAVIAAVAKFGNDFEISAKKAYVSLRRNKQFAIVQPSTASRVDVGINLKGAEPTNRLESSGSFNAMVSHRVRVTEPSSVDKQLIGWLNKAYEQS